MVQNIRLMGLGFCLYEINKDYKVTYSFFEKLELVCKIMSYATVLVVNIAYLFSRYTYIERDMYMCV